MNPHSDEHKNMKVAILAGGFGSRLAEETELRPKPMVEIGGNPILWHVMRHYLAYGHEKFVIALGYKGHFIKRWFSDAVQYQGDMKIDLRRGRVESVGPQGILPDQDWTVNLIETGLHTLTAGRIKRLQPHIGDETFCLTWGDGVSDVDLNALLNFHRSHGKLATVTAVRPSARYGKLDMDGNKVIRFSEKPQLEEGWINGAFFVLEPGIFDYLSGDNVDSMMWENEPLEGLAADGQLMAYFHEGYWQCMDTLREKTLLEDLWASGSAPWKTW